MNSEMHCLAGDATGIVVAAAIVPLLGLTNGWDSVLEYVAGFIFGLFIFQALMMRGMYDGDYWKAVRKTFFAETVSMNCVMAGMLPTMIVLASLWPGSGEPTSAEFWFRMSLASIVGLATAYPVNYWLVSSHLKHGCMTLPGKDSHSLGHRSPEKMEDMPAMAHAAHAHDPHGAHAGGSHKMQMKTLPLSAQILLILASFGLLAIAGAVTNLFVPIRF